MRTIYINFYTIMQSNDVQHRRFHNPPIFEEKMQLGPDTLDIDTRHSWEGQLAGKYRGMGMKGGGRGGGGEGGNTPPHA